MAKEVKTVDFSDVEEFKFDVPSIAEQSKALVVTSNADTLKGKIQSIVKRYKDTELTNENVDYVKTIKSNFVSLRTGIERERKEWSKVYIDPVKNTVDAVCKELQAIVAEGESALAEQLDAYDQKRKDSLTVILEGYKRDAVEQYELREEYATKVVIKEKYYNKTQDEEDSIDDINLQAKEAKKEQVEYDSSVELIKAECEGSTLVYDTYIDQLSYRSPMEIILKIKNDKKVNAELMAEVKAKQEAGEKVVLGEEITVDLKNDVTEEVEENDENEEEEMRVRNIEITYPSSKAKEVSKLFENLTSLGVKWKINK